MEIHKKLSNIQTELKAPKNLYNKFGGYKYRNFEGICEAVKPHLAKHDCSLTLSDSVEQYLDRFYVVATATLIDNESGKSVSVRAMAREALEKKGMDASQITGTASSYARKYALNGLFLLDDTKDADTDEYHEQTTYASKVQTQALRNALEKKGIDEADALKQAGCKSFDKLTSAQYNAIVMMVKG